MATREEKVKALEDMFGAEQARIILDQAERTEQKALEKLDFKEHEGAPEASASEPSSTSTTKAKGKKGKKPMMDKSMMDNAEEEAMEDEEETAEGEQQKDASEPLETSSELAEVSDEDQEALAEDEDYLPLGDVDIKEFGGLLAEAMTAAMQPVLDELITVKEAMDTITLKSAAPDTQSEATQASLKASEAKIAALEKTLAATTAALKELKGDLPRALGTGYRASQADDTTVKEDDDRLKEQPHEDPLSAFTSFAVGKGA